MEYRQLGKSGLKVSALSFGSWVTFGDQLATEKARECMTLAYEHGVNFFDNAEVYAHGQSEVIMGEVLKKTGWARDTYSVSSKVFWGGEKPTQLGLSRKHVVEGCHNALKRLQLDYLDLYFCHRPDLHTPIEETVWAMHTLVMQGKILYWGTSEWNAQQITEAYEIAYKNHLVPPSMEQPEYNLLNRQKVEVDFAPLYKNYGMGTTIWSPLASGILTGKYGEGIPKDSRLGLPGYEWLKSKFTDEEGQKKIKRVTELGMISRRLGITTAEMSLAWCLKNPNVSTVILGASKASQLEENLRAMKSVSKLTPDVIEQIEAIIQTKPVQPQDWKE